MNATYFSLITVIISAVLALLTYLNYSLNKTLNIKNQLYNEKMKLYRELIKLVSEMMIMLDQTDSFLSSYANAHDRSVELLKLPERIDDKVIEIDQLIIEAYMVVPDHVAELLLNFSIFLHQKEPEVSAENYNKLIVEMDARVRELGEGLIKSFREDLRISQLNHKLGKP